MKIGVFNSGWFDRACQALRHELVSLPVPEHKNGPYAADIEARKQSGANLVRLMEESLTELLVDNGGAGIGFVQAEGDPQDVRLAHETAAKPLYSHFIDPMVTAFQGLPWPLVWQCLQSRSWVKALWDQAQVTELQRFGVPNVIHLPMAAPNRKYSTEPLRAESMLAQVSFVGGQNTSYFTANANVPSGSLFPGILAHAVRGDLGPLSFYDVYHELYELAPQITAEDDFDTRVNKTIHYFSAKLFYNAGLCVRNRDRFVLFLKRKLGDIFRVIGKGWDTAYGLPCEPQIEGGDAYFEHFRHCAININLVNGNSEMGLNMRHFEITAAGGFMLCYDQPELSDHFEVGKECVAFADESDLLEKIQYYLAHPAKREEIALAGQRRTLSQHLYSHRLQKMIDLANGHSVGGATSEHVTQETAV